ncbi:hypothetical protein [Nonomuraea aridisoli]|uniref:Uncharacterized protein n=1 Tax=Nonomuraea aridisoli TaxID=2070368 RepID=A0A2W2FEH3_9ACTN|nr:hypothetical protein [Nonomuraea aridisoli]PZG23118.1 hypothetical protein C1J01_01845 [Nonomuraea aridisoli]
MSVVRTDAPAGSLLPLLVRLPEDATSIFDGGVIVVTADDPDDPAITVVEPEPGRYALAVFSFGVAETSFTTQVNTVPVKGGSGSLTLSPRHPEVTPGTPMDLTLSWSGLTGTGRHTGYLEYPDGTGTVVSVG